MFQVQLITLHQQCYHVQINLMWRLSIGGRRNNHGPRMNFSEGLYQCLLRGGIL